MLLRMYTMSRRVNSLARRLAAAPGFCALLVACADEPPGPQPLFLTQTRPASESMQALFVGPLSVDGAGCIRMAGPDRHTVVWPYGFSLADRGDEWSGLDAAGRDVGRIGARMRIAGGEVSTLAEGMVVSGAEDALRRCPGRFWIVGGMVE